jgi:hypothetical protein
MKRIKCRDNLTQIRFILAYRLRVKRFNLAHSKYG